MTKRAVLHEIDSFVNLLYMYMKTGAADFAQKNFPELVNNVWDDSKTEAENLEEIKNMFEMNKKLNETPAGNPEAAKTIAAFQEGWLDKLTTD